jgi:hypothetical protein
MCYIARRTMKNVAQEERWRQRHSGTSCSASRLEPEERQDDAARILLELEAQVVNPYRLTPEQVTEVQRIQQGIRENRETFATDEEMAALWKSCGL